MDQFTQINDLAAKYQKLFDGQSGVETVRERGWARSNYWLNAIPLDSREDREAFLDEANRREIQVRPCWRLMSDLPMYSNSPVAGDLANAREIEDRLVNLPSSATLIAKREVPVVTQSIVIIAEAGVNHNGDVSAALRLVDAALEAGADCVKFQTFDPDLLAAPDADKAAYQAQTTGDGESQRDMLKKLVLSMEDHRRLKTHCSERGIEFLSTPFDNASADMLLELEVPAIKISSGDLTNPPLLRHVASTAKPMIVSTGMATIAEIEEAMIAMRDAGAEDTHAPALRHRLSGGSLGRKPPRNRNPYQPVQRTSRVFRSYARHYGCGCRRRPWGRRR